VRVGIGDRLADEAEQTARDIEAAGGEALGCALDIADRASVEACVAQGRERFGRIDMLVNNAALFSALGYQDFDQIPFEEWDRVIHTNITGSFHCIRAVSPDMKAGRWGRIVNVSSVAADFVNAGQTNYAASKAGLIGMTKSIAKELGSRNILANVVAPGFIETDMTAAMTPEARQALSAGIPLERLGTPEDVAGMVAVLASDLAGYVTGQVFVVDGGMVM
jgi:3-oxoacyl-[acyl-carrier protein] reductase